MFLMTFSENTHSLLFSLRKMDWSNIIKKRNKKFLPDKYYDLFENQNTLNLKAKSLTLQCYAHDYAIRNWLSRNHF